MVLKIEDRVRETTITTGTGTLDLQGQVTGFQSFVDAIGDGNTTYYAIVHRSADEWELGIGTVDDQSTDTLARTTVISSSNSDSAVSFSAGVKDVFVTLPSSKSSFLNGSNSLIIGNGAAGVDYSLTFDGETNDGVITWKEDEDYFEFSDDILMSSTEKIQFGDTASFIQQSTNGTLRIDGEAIIDLNASTRVDVSGDLKVGGEVQTASIGFTDGDNAIVIADGGGITASTSLTLASGSTVTSIKDEDNMASDSATALATQQSIKAFVAASITAEDLDVTTDSGTIAIDLDSETLTVAGGTGLASSASSNTVTLAVDAAQTGITSLLATDIKIGEDDQTKIDFETADEIHFYAANVEQVYLGDNIFGPQSDSDVDLGSTGVRWKDAFVDSVTVTGEVDAVTLDISGNADIDGTTNLDVVDIDGAVDMATTLTLGGNADFNGDLDVDGTTNLDVVDIDGAVDMATTLALGGNADFNGDLDVDGTTNLDNTDIDGTLVVDGSNISLDSTSTLNIDNSNTTNGVAIGTATSGVPVSIGHSTSEVTVNDNLTVTGNFTVSGTSTTVDSTTVSVADSMFKLAKDQGTSADALDFGFYGQYGVGGTAKFAGVFRDVSATGDPFTFFDDLQAEPGTTVNTGGTGYDLADVVVGGLSVADTLDVTGVLTGTSLDISGDIDIDGTTNLDVVDIDGAVDMASTLQVDGSITSSDGMTITTADNSDTLTLVSTDADAASGPNLRLYRNNDSNGDDDLLGAIEFEGRNDNSQDVVYAQMSIESSDISDGEEDANWFVKVMSAGTLRNLLQLNASEVVFNQDSQDTNFRVESNGNPHMISVDAGNDHVNIGTSSDLGGVLNVSGAGVFQTADNTDTLSLISTDTDDDIGPNLRLFRAVTGADNDSIGTIDLAGKDDGGNNTDYASITGQIVDASNGNEDGKLTFKVMNAGSLNQMLTISGPETVVNEGSKDHDFRVESNDNANAIFVNGGTNSVTIGASGTVSSIAGVNVLFEANSIFIGDDVSGTTDTAANSVAFGIDALDAVTTGDANVALGKSTLSGNTTGGNNIAIGNQALNAPDTESNNLAIGSNALNGAVAGGEQNVAIGNSSLAALTSADNNVAIGYLAGTAITTGGNNTAIGSQTLQTLTTATRNTAVGTTAMQNATSALANTAVGYQSMIAVTEGDTNVAIGATALAALTTGSNNIGIGSAACAGFDTETANLGIGTSALGGSVAGGEYNVAIGNQALDALTSGDQNVAVGFATGTALQGGSNNTFVGNASGAAQTSASNNVLIGGDAGAALTTGGSNVFIGYTAGDGHDTEGSNLGIGQAALGGAIAGGEFNVAVGNSSGEDLTSADHTAMVGYQAGANVTEGSGSTFMGYQAGFNTNTGQDNVYMGKTAGRGNTTGGRNIALGFGSIYNADTETNNLAVGYAALGGSVAGGEYNVAVGNHALDALTTSDANVAIGYNAGTDITTGDNCVYVGYQAGLNATEGSSNTFIGMEAAGLGVVTGGANVAVGTQALYDLTSAANNTAIGYRAGYNITTGPHNVIVGKDAGGKVTEGEKNVILGSQAGAELVGDGGDFNILIGYAAGNALTTTNSSIFIGHESGDGHDTEVENIGIGRNALGGSINGGEYNVAVGNHTLAALVGADLCVAVGYNAGNDIINASGNTLFGTEAGSVITSGSNNTAVGRNAGLTNESGDNNIQIGYNAKTSANNTSHSIVIGVGIATVADRVAIGKNGGLIFADFASSATWTQSSDERLKNNITSTDLGLEFVNELRPVTYKWKDTTTIPEELTKQKTEVNAKNTETLQYGLIAQEVKSAMDKVGHDKFTGWDLDEDNTQCLREGQFIYPLIKAVQELSAQVTTLQQEIKTIKGE